MSWMAHKIIMQLRDDLWSKVLHLPIEYFDRTETGEIMSRITNDTIHINTQQIISIHFSIGNFLLNIIIIYTFYILFLKCYRKIYRRYKNEE